MDKECAEILISIGFSRRQAEDRSDKLREVLNKKRPVIESRDIMEPRPEYRDVREG